MAKKNNSAQNIRYARIFVGLLVSIMVLFGLSAVFVKDTEIRSKAALVESIYKQWEFNGESTEGWTGSASTSVAVTHGILRFSIDAGRTIPAVKNQEVNTTLPKGKKRISLNVSIGNINSQITPTSKTCEPPPTCAGMQRYTDNEHPLRTGCPSYKCIPITTPSWVRSKNDFGGFVQGAQAGTVNEESVFQQGLSARTNCTQETTICPDGTIVGRSGVSCEFLGCPDGSSTATKKFTGKLWYSIEKSDKRTAVMQKPIAFSGVADGSYHEISVQLPDIDTTTLKTIRVQFTSGIKMGTPILIDWVRILGTIPTNPSTTCIPRPSCLDATPACLLPDRSSYCPLSTTPTPTCYPRPSCMDPLPGEPACMIKLPDGGWFCPKPIQTVTSTVSPSTSCAFARNGASCSIDSCPKPLPCPSGEKCVQPMYKCSVYPGTCQNGQCVRTTISTTPTPPPGCYYQQVKCAKAPCSPILVCPTTSSAPVSSGGCMRQGCSGELCVDAASKQQFTTCVYREEYACYQDATCERQSTGLCGWTPSVQLTSCLNTATQ